jgi:hypothetical protein
MYFLEKTPDNKTSFYLDPFLHTIYIQWKKAIAPIKKEKLNLYVSRIANLLTPMDVLLEADTLKRDKVATMRVVSCFTLLWCSFRIAFGRNAPHIQTPTEIMSFNSYTKQLFPRVLSMIKLTVETTDDVLKAMIDIYLRENTLLETERLYWSFVAYAYVNDNPVNKYRTMLQRVFHTFPKIKKVYRGLATGTWDQQTACHDYFVQLNLKTPATSNEQATG